MLMLQAFIGILYVRGLVVVVMVRCFLVVQ